MPARATSGFYTFAPNFVAMSDTVDELDFWGRQVLNQSRVTPLREEMEAFVSRTEPVDIVELRRRTSGGADLSEIVTSDREERI